MGLWWWVQIMGVEVVREEEVFGFVGIHGREGGEEGD